VYKPSHRNRARRKMMAKHKIEQNPNKSKATMAVLELKGTMEARREE
jgi:hypothetical protein